MKKAQENSRGEFAFARNFEQLVELGQPRAARRQRPARRPHRRLAVAVRVRAARLRHPHRAAARRRASCASASTACCTRSTDPDVGADRDDVAHQAARADGDRREAPAAGWPHQDASRPTGEEVELRISTHADRVRRKDRDADLQPGSAGPRLPRSWASPPTTAQRWER